MVLSQKNKRKVSGFFSAQCDNLPGWKDVLKKYAVVKANLLYAFNEKKKKKKSLYLASMETVTYWICVVNL